MLEVGKKYRLPHSNNYRLSIEEQSYLILELVCIKKVTSAMFDYVFIVENRIGNQFDEKFFEIGKSINLVKKLAETQLEDI